MSSGEQTGLENIRERETETIFEELYVKFTYDEIYLYLSTLESPKWVIH